VIRQATQSDLNFITSNWLKQYRGSIFARNMSKDIYFKNYNKILNQRLIDSVNIVVCDKEDPYVIHGFASVERPNIIHYIFVKNHFRGYGVGKRLFVESLRILDNPSDIIHSHLPKFKKFPKDIDFIYNPFVFLSKEIIYEN